jgi:drug/metabolite transporter (DMT)-like permease
MRITQTGGVALYLLLCVIWGSTWLIIKVGYGGLGPFNVAALRFFIAGAIFCLLVPLLRAPWPRGRTEWALVVWVGVVLFAGDYGFIYWGEQFLDSGLTAIVFAVHPTVTIVLAHFYLSGDRLTGRKIVGTLLAFFGVVALFGERARFDPAGAIPVAAIVAGAACASAVAVASKRHGGTLHPAALNAPATLIGAVALAVASLLAGDGLRLPADWLTWGAIGYLSVAGSVVSFLVYFSLLKTWTVTSLSFISIFAPALALLLGFLFRDERPSISTLVGGVLILAGVTLALAAAPVPEAKLRVETSL